MVARIQLVARPTRTLEASDPVLTQLRATSHYLALINVYNRNNSIAYYSLISTTIARNNHF